MKFLERDPAVVAAQRAIIDAHRELDAAVRAIDNLLHRRMRLAEGDDFGPYGGASVDDLRAKAIAAMDRWIRAHHNYRILLKER